MMDRLTQRIDGYAHGAEGRDAEHLTGKYCRGKFEATAIVERLADYEDAEEQGLLLHLPCKIGTPVYKEVVMHDSYDDTPYTRVSAIPFNLTMLPEIGKSVFLTKEEAEFNVYRNLCLNHIKEL